MSNDWIPDFESGLDDGDVAVAAVVICQAITPDGRTTYYVKYTPGLDDMTAVGMLDAALGTLRDEIQSRWRNDDDR